MRTREALFSVAALLFCLFLFALGLFFIVGARSVSFYNAWVAFPQSQFPLIGGAAFLGAAFFLGLFFLFSRRRYLLIRMGGGHQLKVMEQTLAELVTQEIQIPCDVIVRQKEKIEILVDLPYGSEETLDVYEAKIERALANHLGYVDEFLLNVSFKQTFSAR